MKMIFFVSLDFVFNIRIQMSYYLRNLSFKKNSFYIMNIRNHVQFYLIFPISRLYPFITNFILTWL